MLLGGAGNDLIVGDSSTNFTAINILNGFGGNDTITSRSWLDQVNAGAGDDLVGSFAQQTDQVVNGGTGHDGLVVSSLSSINNPINVTLGSTFVFIINGINGATYMNFEALDVTLGTGANTVTGGAGHDTLSLSFVQSQTGSGTAIVEGGAGLDVVTLTLIAATTALVLDLSAATVTLANGALFTGIEGFRLQSTAGHDSIIASNDLRGAAYNTIDGGSGNDTLQASSSGAALNGGFGIDLLLGSTGHDGLSGGFGGENDTLRGFAGNDTLAGGTGRDLLVGGIGADHFALLQYYESGTTNLTRDLIDDFRRAQGDLIDLFTIDARVLAGDPGDQAFVFIGTGPFANAGELRFELVDLAGTADDHTLIHGNINGDIIADFSIEVKGLITFQATNFVL